MARNSLSENISHPRVIFSRIGTAIPQTRVAQKPLDAMLYKGEGKKSKETETVRSLFLAGDVQVWRLKVAAAEVVVEAEAYSVLGGSDYQVCLLDIHLSAFETICD